MRLLGAHADWPFYALTSQGAEKCDKKAILCLDYLSWGVGMIPTQAAVALFILSQEYFLNIWG